MALRKRERPNYVPRAGPKKSDTCIRPPESYSVCGEYSAYGPVPAGPYNRYVTKLRRVRRGINADSRQG